MYVILHYHNLLSLKNF